MTTSDRFAGHWRVGTALMLLAFVVIQPSVRANGFRFLIPDTDGFPGETISIAIDGSYAEPAQGLSLALSYPSADLTVHAMTVVDTILEAISADFIDSRIDSAQGLLTFAVLTDTSGSGGVLPAIGQPLTLVYIEATIDTSVQADIQLSFVDGAFSPPVTNVYVVNNQSVPVTELTTGTVEVRGLEKFIRGDCNLDKIINISDPIMILNYKFAGASLECERAADANADSQVDIADPLFLLQFLFQQGSTPPAPFPEAGHDFVWSFRMACDEPLE